MKKLICASDMDIVVESGKKSFYIEKNSIVTPSAYDIAKENGIKISDNKKEEKIEKDIKQVDTFKDFDMSKMIDVFKSMMSEGLLEEMLKELLKQNSKKYSSEIDESGVKLIRGNTVKMDLLKTEQENSKVQYQDVINKEESKMNAGFLIIEESKFMWKLLYEEIDYVIDGSISIQIDERKYIASKGDVIFIPKGTEVTWEAIDKAKILYTRCLV